MDADEFNERIVQLKLESRLSGWREQWIAQWEQWARHIEPTRTVFNGQITWGQHVDRKWSTAIRTRIFS